MNGRFHHMHLICNDLEEMIGFFTNIIGAKLVERRRFGTANGASLDLGGVTVNLRVARDDEDITEDAARPRFGYDHLGVQVDDVDAAYDQLRAKGFAFTVPPKDIGALKIAFFKGPDNIMIELVERLGERA
jgi:catechol 2,3-dioxygenase-like lactoylglutathione lyase family enzyme